MKHDIAYPTVVRMRAAILRMNRINVGRLSFAEIKLALAKKVCGTRPEVFANDRQKCQEVLDTIDALFSAKG